uniref:Cryptic protein-like n=1 Tax=Callorhinchus milii TaxID=7868 RepID=A0A4W3JI78_CALMI
MTACAGQDCKHVENLFAFRKTPRTMPTTSLVKFSQDNYRTEEQRFRRRRGPLEHEGKAGNWTHETVTPYNMESGLARTAPGVNVTMGHSIASEDCWKTVIQPRIRNWDIY